MIGGTIIPIKQLTLRFRPARRSTGVHSGMIRASEDTPLGSTIQVIGCCQRIYIHTPKRAGREGTEDLDPCKGLGFTSSFAARISSSHSVFALHLGRGEGPLACIPE